MKLFGCIPIFTRHVEYMDKRQCNLNHVPDEVSRYGRSLEVLLLDSNHIKDIPKHVFRLQKLRQLALSDNEIHKIPQEICHLNELEEFDVSKNDIQEVPDSIKQCKHLLYVDLSSNPITRIPDSLFQLSNLTSLGLNDISMTSLPNDIGQLVTLEALEARENLLRSLPSSIGQLKKLKRLDVGSNEFETLPIEIGCLENLQELYVDCNELDSLPQEMRSLKQLQSLDVAENKITCLPDDFGELINLTDVTLSQNCLEVLPHSVGRLKKLSILKVDKNRLIALTPAVGTCTSLTELILTDNLLQELPSSLGNLKKLTVLNVDRNRLGEVPSTIGSCQAMTVLSLRNNALDVLPFEVGKLQLLRVLDVSGNRLRSLPYTLNALANLHALWLSDNQSQPLLKLQVDNDQRTGVKVLTCYLLPQSDAILTDDKVEAEDSTPGQNGFVGGPKVHFPDVDAAENSDEESIGRFERHDTPHPKHPNKPKGRQIDGHVIAHEQGKKDSTFQVGDGRKRTSIDGGDKDSSVGIPLHVSGDQAASALSKKGADRPSKPPPVPPRASMSPSGEVTSQSEQEESTTGKAVNFDTTDDEERVESRLKRKNTPHPVKSTALDRASGQAEAKVISYLSSDSKATVNGPVAGQAQVVGNEQRLKVTVCRTDQGLGLSIAGGLGSTPYKDNDSSIFISKVVEGGAADMAGLRQGDRLLAVNGRSVVNTEHNKAVEVMKLAGTVVQLDVSRECVAPSTVNDTHQETGEPTRHDGSTAGDRAYETISTTIKRESSGLGFSVAGGTGTGDEGIFISRITPGGAADRDGKLKVGDRVLLINGVNMKNARHDQAVYLLTGCSSEVLLVVQREKAKGLRSPDSAVVKSFAVPEGRVANDDQKKETLGKVEDDNLLEEVVVTKTTGALGLSIVGGIDHSCHPFGGCAGPGIFISKVVSDGAAGRTGHLRLGDRLLAVDDKDLTAATHHEAVSALMAPSQRVVLTVRHEPLPPGFRDLTVTRRASEPLGIEISGGVNGSIHPTDPSDEGVFVSNILANSAVSRDGRLRLGDRIIEVNNKSFLGVSLQQAADVLNASGAHVHFLLCDGVDPVCLNSLRDAQAARPCNGNVASSSSSKIPVPTTLPVQRDAGKPAMGRSFELPPPVAPKPKVKLLAQPCDSPPTDPLVESRLPAARDVAKAKASSISPDGGQPERLPFVNKVERFQKEIGRQAPERSKIPEASHAIRTKKSELRYKASCGTVDSEALNLSPAEQRALDAEKRAAWRQERLKSLEADAVKAEQVMEKVRKLTENCEQDSKKMASVAECDEAEPMVSSVRQNYRQVHEGVDPVTGDRVVKSVESCQVITKRQVETVEKRILTSQPLQDGAGSIGFIDNKLLSSANEIGSPNG